MSWPGIDHWMGGPDGDELIGTTWEQLGALKEAGWKTGSHTCSHPRLSELSDAALLRELRNSRRVCEDRLGNCRSLGVPYGDGEGRVPAAAYRAVAGLPGADASSSPGWPRVGVYPADAMGRFGLKVARSVRRLPGFRLVRPLAVAARMPPAGRPYAER